MLKLYTLCKFGDLSTLLKFKTNVRSYTTDDVMVQWLPTYYTVFENRRDVYAIN